MDSARFSLLSFCLFSLSLSLPLAMSSRTRDDFTCDEIFDDSWTDPIAIRKEMDRIAKAKIPLSIASRICFHPVAVRGFQQLTLASSSTYPLLSIPKKTQPGSVIDLLLTPPPYIDFPTPPAAREDNLLNSSLLEWQQQQQQEHRMSPSSFLS
jgi:hypothetical protein